MRWSPAGLAAATGRRSAALVRRIYARYIRRDPFILALERWFRDAGDQTRRFGYTLDGESVVLDLGGYQGDFTAQVTDKWGCYVYLFEPSPRLYEECRKRFQTSPKVKCFNFGLSDESGEFLLSDQCDASSIKHERASVSPNTKLVQVRAFSEVFAELGIARVDLLKINIEGGEYDVLPHIISTGLISRIDNIQVQFHNFVVDAIPKRNAIVNALARTHRRAWCYEFVWESWTLNADNGAPN